MRFLKKIQPILSFELKKNPVIARTRSDYRKYIPEPYEGVVLISSDFELAWAWRYSKKNASDPVAFSREMAKTERNNIALILSLCDEYNIPLTWATVGHLFLDSCKKVNGRAHQEIKRLPYFENKWWKYDSDDWFNADPCSNVEQAPEWYCPDLIQQIIDAKAGHEIGCHTFSHIACTDGICPPDVLESELQACVKVAEPFGIKLESFVFTGHTMGNFETIRRMGYSSVRTNYVNILGYPILHKNGLWQHETTMELLLHTAWPVWYNIYRYKKIIEQTVKTKAVCNLWFHPSMPVKAMSILFTEVFKVLDANRERLWITTMSNYTKWLNNNLLRL